MSKDENMKKIDAVVVVVASLLAGLSDTANRCGPNYYCTCYTTEFPGTTVDCRGAQLNVSQLCEVCETIPNVTSLDLSNVNHKCNLSIKDGCFQDCTKLKQLYLASNNISYIGNSAFEGLYHLELLDLDDNRFIVNGSIVNPIFFQNLTNLQILRLQGNSDTVTVPQNQSYLYNIPVGLFMALERLFIDGPENVQFGANFRGFNTLRYMVFTGKHAKCNIVSLTNKTFEHLTKVSHLDLAFCNLSYIDSGTFQGLANLKYLNLSHNEGLGYPSLRNVSFGLQATQIEVLDYSKVYRQFGLSTELRRCDVWYLRNTTIKELYLDNNRLALFEVNALLLFPPLVEVLSVVKNQFTFGPYVMQIACLQHLKRLELNQQYNFAKVDSYQNDFGVKERYTDQSNKDACQVPKETHLSSGCPYLNSESFDVHNFTIPPRLKIANIRDSNLGLTRISKDAHLVKLRVATELESVDASYNIIPDWNTPAFELQSLKHLDISNNFASSIMSDLFTRVPNLIKLNASNNLLGTALSEDIDGQIFNPLDRLQVLDLSANRIPFIPGKLFSTLSNLSSLNLSYNGINEVYESLNWLTNLTELNLRQNKLSTLPVQILQQMVILASKQYRNVSIDLSNNTLEISCDNLDFLNWIVQYPGYFQNVNSYIYRYNGQNTLKSHASLGEKIRSLNKTCKSYTAAIIVSLIFITGFIFSVLGGLANRYRWRLRYFYYMAKSRYKGYDQIQGDTVQYRYDAFISYSHEDYLFIKDEIIVELEDHSGFSLCVHQRNFLPGNYIAENILQAIKNSRMIVVVLTNQFLQSKWCIYEFIMARMESIYSRNSENIVITVMYEDIDTNFLSPELIQSLGSETFLRYPQEEGEKPYFWELLKQAIADNN